MICLLHRQIPNALISLTGRSGFSHTNTGHGHTSERTATHLVVELAVDRFAFRVDQFEGVRSVAIHMAISIRQATIAEEERHL